MTQKFSRPQNSQNILSDVTMKRECPFIFEISDRILSDPNNFILRIPQGIQTVDELFNYYIKEAKFPQYYGGNWDAFKDCLCDFSWIEQHKIIILHEDLPLMRKVKDAQTYVDILITAVNVWKLDPEAENYEYILDFDYKLIVFFPKKIEPIIDAILGDIE